MTIERFLGCAESAVLILGKPIRLQNEQPAGDKRVTCKRLGIILCQDKTEVAHSACGWQKPASWRDNLRGWLRCKGILLSAALL